MKDEAVREWIPIVQELVRRGVTSVPELVYTFTFRSFELDDGPDIPIPLSLLRALPTVAEALGRNVEDIAKEVVATAARVDEERELRRRCKQLLPFLERLPAVRSVSAPNYGSQPLTTFFRQFARARGIPIPKLAESDPKWKALLTTWPSPNPLELQAATRGMEVTLVSGEVLQPLHPDVSDQTIAEILRITPDEVRKASDQDLVSKMMASGPSGVASAAKRVEVMLKRLPDVKAVRTVPRLKTSHFPAPEYEGAELPPPWTVFSEPPTSMRWRMGPGEDTMSSWWDFWNSLSPTEQHKYFERFPPPSEWQSWAQRALSSRN